MDKKREAEEEIDEEAPKKQKIEIKSWMPLSDVLSSLNFVVEGKKNLSRFEMDHLLLSLARFPIVFVEKMIVLCVEGFTWSKHNPHIFIVLISSCGGVYDDLFDGVIKKAIQFFDDPRNIEKCVVWCMYNGYEKFAEALINQCSYPLTECFSAEKIYDQCIDWMTPTVAKAINRSDKVLPYNLFNIVGRNLSDLKSCRKDFLGYVISAITANNPVWTPLMKQLVKNNEIDLVSSMLQKPDVTPTDVEFVVVRACVKTCNLRMLHLFFDFGVNVHSHVPELLLHVAKKLDDRLHQSGIIASTCRFLFDNGSFADECTDEDLQKCLEYAIENLFDEMISLVTNVIMDKKTTVDEANAQYNKIFKSIKQKGDQLIVARALGLLPYKIIKTQIIGILLQIHSGGMGKINREIRVFEQTGGYLSITQRNPWNDHFDKTVPAYARKFLPYPETIEVCRMLMFNAKYWFVIPIDYMQNILFSIDLNLEAVTTHILPPSDETLTERNIISRNLFLPESDRQPILPIHLIEELSNSVF